MTTDSILGPAMAYAKHGWRVFPVHGVRSDRSCTCGKVNCDDVGKHPWTRNGFKDASIDPDTIRNMFRGKSDANIGIATGLVSNLLVVDWDPRNDGQRPDTLPETMEVLTGGGGGHLYFRTDVALRSKTSVKPGIDIKADGGYVVAPPSRHASGRNYEWEVEHHFEDIELAEVPEAVISYLGREVVVPSAQETRHYQRGQRNNFLTSIAGTLRQKGIGEEALKQSLLLLNSASCNPPLPDAEVASIAKSVSRYEPGAVAPDRTALVLCAADADETPVEWLWDRRIPVGCMVGIEGDPGLGKSTITCQIAAAITRGTPLPDSLTPCGEPGNVLFLTSEDDPGQVVKGRLRDAGADLNRVHFVLGVISRDSEGTEPEDLITLLDLDKIEEQMEKLKPRLIIIDPLQAYIPPDVDMHRANETRPILARVAILLKQHNAAAIVVRHLSKSSKGQGGIHRGLGSMDIAAAVRSLLTVSNHPDDEDDDGRRVIVHGKSNYGQKAETIGFSFGDNGFTWDGVLPRIRESHVRASESSVPRKATGGRKYREECSNWLLDELKEGPKTRGELLRACNFGEGTLKRAADELGVIRKRPEKVGEQGIWRLPTPGDTESSKENLSGPTSDNPEKPRETPSEQLSTPDGFGPTQTPASAECPERPECGVNSEDESEPFAQ